MSDDLHNQPIDIDDIPMPEAVETEDVVDEFKSPGAFNLSFVGVGQGGSRICETFYRIGYRRIACINTTAKDLEHINIPSINKLVIPTADRASGDGAGKNPAIANEAIRRKTEEVYDLLRRCWGDKYDWSFVCLGAGGGTGAGTMEAALETASKLMSDLKLESKVGVIVALPKNDEGQKVAANSIETMKKLNEIFKDNKTPTPIVIIDNERIKSIYPKTPVNQFWQVANKGVCTLLHLFNQISAQSSPHTTFDPADFTTLLSSGVVAFGATVVDKYESQADISQAIRKQLQENILASVDMSKGQCAGCIFIGGENILDAIPQDYLDHGFEMLTRLMAANSTVHRGIYVGSRPDLRAYTMVGGLPFPSERLTELMKMAKR